MTVVTEIYYILDPVKEAASCQIMEEAAEKQEDGWIWEVRRTTGAYMYTKRMATFIEEVSA